MFQLNRGRRDLGLYMLTRSNAAIFGLFERGRFLVSAVSG